MENKTKMLPRYFSETIVYFFFIFRESKIILIGYVKTKKFSEITSPGSFFFTLDNFQKKKNP